MKPFLLLLLLSITAFGRFDEKEIMSLSSQERIELLQHLQDSQKKELADSIAMWGTRSVMNKYKQAMEDYPKMIEGLKEQMDKSMSRMASQVGFAILFNVISFILTLSTGLLMYRKIRSVRIENGKTIIPGRKYYLIWLITILSLFIIYAAANFIAF